MSIATSQPSQRTLARLRDPNASSDQFSSDELRKVYLDDVCFGSGLLPYSIIGAAIGGAVLAGDVAHLSAGGIAVAFFITLFVVAGIAHAVMGWWFNVLPHETAFTRVQEWALSHGPRDSGARLISAASRLVVPLLIIGVLLAAALTLPDKAKHEAELRQAVTVAINATEAKSGEQILGKAAAWVLNATFKDNPTASYIDFFGLEYQKFGVFSIVKNDKGELISIGAFNQVYVRNLSPSTTHN